MNDEETMNIDNNLRRSIANEKKKFVDVFVFFFVECQQRKSFAFVVSLVTINTYTRTHTISQFDCFLCFRMTLGIAEYIYIYMYIIYSFIS